MCDLCASRMLSGFKQDEKEIATAFISFLVYTEKNFPQLNLRPFIEAFTPLIPNFHLYQVIVKALENKSIVPNMELPPGTIVYIIKSEYYRYYGFYVPEPVKWTDHCWKLIDYIFNTAIKDQKIDIFTKLFSILPCDKCREHSVKYLSTNTNDIGSEDWVIKFKETINKEKEVNK